MIYLSKSKYCGLWQCPKIQYIKPEEQKKTRENLLKYCGLDTYAMVKVWEDLKRVAE